MVCSHHCNCESTGHNGFLPFSFSLIGSGSGIADKVTVYTDAAVAEQLIRICHLYKLSKYITPIRSWENIIQIIPIQTPVDHMETYRFHGKLWSFVFSFPLVVFAHKKEGC